MSRNSVRDLFARGVFKKLALLGPNVLPHARSALSDPDWRVRRNALRLLDHSTDSQSVPRMIELLKDDHEEVRKWAAHALGCDRCKNGAGLPVDPVPQLIEVVEHDPSLIVRRSAIVCLAWNRPVDSRIRNFLLRLAASTDDQKIRLHAEGGAKRHSEAVPPHNEDLNQTGNLSSLDQLSVPVA